MILVKGSDSAFEFRNQCRSKCERNCGPGCRKLDQGIRIYRNYLNQNFEQLTMGFQFFGGVTKGLDIIEKEPYFPGKEYDSIFVKLQ